MYSLNYITSYFMFCQDASGLPRTRNLKLCMHCQVGLCTPVCAALLGLLDASWASLGCPNWPPSATWTPVGPSSCPPSATWSPLGPPNWPPSATWTSLGPTWTYLGATWTLLGATWALLGTTWTSKNLKKCHTVVKNQGSVCSSVRGG